jgi:hypothetical protein
MEEPDDIFDMILDHEINIVNVVADVILISDLQILQQSLIASKRRAPRHPTR